MELTSQPQATGKFTIINITHVYITDNCKAASGNAAGEEIRFTEHY